MPWPGPGLECEGNAEGGGWLGVCGGCCCCLRARGGARAERGVLSGGALLMVRGGGGEEVEELWLLLAVCSRWRLWSLAWRVVTGIVLCLLSAWLLLG